MPVTQHAELVLAVQADSAKTINAIMEMLSNKTVSLGRSAQRYSIANVEPDPSIDYSIRIVEPDPTISYKILRADPGENANSPFEVTSRSRERPSSYRGDGGDSFTR
jgi:hypothetical protein